MKLKRILKERDRTILAVDRETHAMVKGYARQKGLSVAEATWRLLGIGLAVEAGILRIKENK